MVILMLADVMNTRASSTLTWFTVIRASPPYRAPVYRAPRTGSRKSGGHALTRRVLSSGYNRDGGDSGLTAGFFRLPGIRVDR